MTLAVAVPLTPNGRAKPRIAPPVPARSDWRAFIALAHDLGIELYPWQETAARYLMALGTGDKWLYPEVAVIVGRQNGKTTLLLPLIIGRLLAGQRIIHTAQNRELPRFIHDQVGKLLFKHFNAELPEGRSRGIRYGAGQEEVSLLNGGRYQIVAPTRAGARGISADLLIIDELREMEDHGFVGDAEPALSASPNPQMVYLSNAGTETSEVLNSIKRRAEEDPALAYLEWSAGSERRADDVAGWREANPAVGHMPGKLDYLSRKYNSYKLAGTLSIFETEHLCRWVKTMRETLVDMDTWKRGEGTLGEPTRVFMGISLDPSGTRASAALAWQQPDNTMDLRLLLEGTGNPINVDKLGRELRDLAREHHVMAVGFDPLTDGVLAKYLPRTEAIAGQKYANASARFVTLTEAGKLRWTDCAAVGNDLTWTARKEHDESGSFQAVRANDERPITAALASIRAVLLASSPPFERKPRVGVGHG